MTDDGRAFRLLRAEKFEDCREWLPEDCIDEFVSEVKAGKIKPTKVLILYTVDAEDGREAHRWFASSLTKEETLWLMETRRFLDFLNMTE